MGAQEFAQSCLGHGCVLAVHGLRRGVSARQVLLHAAAAHRYEAATNLKYAPLYADIPVEPRFKAAPALQCSICMGLARK